MGESDRQLAEMSYFSYLVRLWRDGPHAPWRALAKDVSSGQEYTFANLESLFVFLHEMTANDNDQFDGA